MPLFALVFAAVLLLIDSSDLKAAISFSNQAEAAGVADAGEGNGGAFGDYDGDGWPDLLVVRTGRGEGVLLYHNQGDGRFADAGFPVEGEGQALGGAFVDIEGDGDLDIFLILFSQPDLLLRNDEGVFVRVGWPDSLQDNRAGVSAAFADFNRDGVLDLFVTHRATLSNQFYSRIYQEGFVEQSDLLSSLRSGNESFGALPFDFDNDGDLDLYISSLGFPNLLHRNEGRGTFRQVIDASGAQEGGASLAAFPADFDNDGDLDLFILTGANQTNTLFENEGEAHFSDATAALGIQEPSISTGAAWADFDNDGDLDLFVSAIGRLRVYENRGEGTFAEVGETAIPSDLLDQGTNTAGVAVADYDRDGDVDVFVAGLDREDLLLRNDTAAPGHWLSLELRAAPGEAMPLGARVWVETEAGMQLREYVVASQVGSLHGDLLHFGLGAASRAERVVVEWPTGLRQDLGAVQADQVLRLTQPKPGRDLRIGAVLRPDLAPRWEPLAPEVEVYNAGRARVEGAVLRGRITRGKRQVYSAEVAVPALAAGEKTQLRLPAWTPVLSGTHSFSFSLELDDEISANNTWERTHSLYPFEDVAPRLGVADAGKGWAGAFSDYDNDGDLDIYLVNGGSLGAGANLLYRNDGEAGFSDVTEASGTADEGNGTGLVFADFDRDGDQDLFLSNGGFMLPGEANRFFRNRGDGTFEDISAELDLGPNRASYAAVAGDFDRDGFLDLYLAQFRGQFNLLFQNQGDGTFEEVSAIKNIASFQRFAAGSAAFADFDNDGDQDLYASIFGDFDVFYADVGDTAFAASRVGDRGDSVGMSIGDFDNDGAIDVYVVNQDGRSVLYRNDIEALSFVDVGAESGTENLGPGTGVAFGDFDNDGDQDLFVVNGHQPDRLYMNLGDGTFADQARAFGLADSSRARSVMLGDFDNDGDLDTYVINEGSENRLYRNGGNQYNWLKVGVQGVESNTDGIGARVQLFAGGQVLHHEINGTAGLSHSSRIAHFGLGIETSIDSLRVRWPRGQVDVYRDLAVNTSVRLVEGERLTAVEREESRVLPQRFTLEQNFPNPFNASTVIGFAVARPGPVRLILYNTLGQRVLTLVDEELAAGSYRTVWEGVDQQGRPAASGVYFYRLEAGGHQLRRSMVLLR